MPGTPLALRNFRVYTNSHLNHVIRTASFPPWLCIVPLARTSSTPRFTQLCQNEKSAMLDAMFQNRISMNPHGL